VSLGRKQFSFSGEAAHQGLKGFSKRGNPVILKLPGDGVQINPF